VQLPDDRNHEVSTGCDSDADLQAVRTVGLTHGNDDMHNWLRSCYALTSPLAGRLIHSPAAVTVAVILRGSMALAQSAPGSGREVSANELARRVVVNELKFQDEDHAQWMYRQEKEESGKKQVVRIVETKDGSLSRLLAINGHPLTEQSDGDICRKLRPIESGTQTA
jgi:hypothetical protein